MAILKLHRLFLLLALGQVLVLSNAFAVVYKWVDEEGNVSYSDTPQVESPEEVKIIRKPSSGQPGNRSDAERKEYQRKFLESMTEERKRKEKVKAEEKAEQEKRQKKCEAARKELQKIQQARYVYYDKENGERDVLDDVRRQKAVDDVKAQVEKHCN